MSFFYFRGITAEIDLVDIYYFVLAGIIAIGCNCSAYSIKYLPPIDVFLYLRVVGILVGVQVAVVGVEAEEVEVEAEAEDVAVKIINLLRCLLMTLMMTWKTIMLKPSTLEFSSIETA